LRNQSTTKREETEVMMMTTNAVLVGTRPVASLHRRCTAGCVAEITVTYAMISVAEMHATGLKTDA
jgi:hypothetical protein